MAEDLRIPMADSMKMVPAPWIPKKVVDMDELYTELTLEKNDRTLFKKEHVKLENYKELFAWHNPGMLKYIDIRYYSPHPFPMRKILIKGGPGMGKTSLSKKIAWDWAKRLFVKVSIVFFVFLKLVKPGDFIEDAIVQQTRKLQKKQIERKRLINILEHFGHRCLLILDGYDECLLGQNEQLTDILSGLKFENCNIILTSRPHSIVDIEEYFDTIISVEGFTQSEARKFASRIVDDRKKIKAVLNFNPAGERSDRPVHNAPILLSFLCVLVREDNIDLSDKTISIGEIYFRMVQCLYKKFTIRKGIKFKKCSLVTVLMSIGKLALETLLSGKSELERSQIIEQVGEEVFEYGLLIDEDGFSLTRDMTVDILVTFPHRSLQEFLGAFYFVLTLGQKQTIGHLDKALLEYLKNPLFSKFCLWILDESNEFFSFSERSIAYENLNIYVSKQIDAVEVDFQKLERNYPVLRMALRDSRKEFALKILEGALMKCSRIEYLVIEPHHPIDRILRSISPFIFHRLNSIKISHFQEKRDKFELIPDESPLQFLYMWHDHSFKLTVKCDFSTQSIKALHAVLKGSKNWNRSVYLCVGRSMPQTPLQDSPLVHIFSTDKMYPHLVDFILPNCDINPSDMSHIAAASAQGRLPKLSTLDISNNLKIGGNLSVLLSQSFPSLHTLIMTFCYLRISDIHSLAQARKEARLPQLRHLDVSFNFALNFGRKSHSDKSLLLSLFQQGIPTLNTLVVRSCFLKPDDLYTLYPQEEENNNFLSELTTLDISVNQTIGGSLSALMFHYLLHLQILVLRECELNSGDLTSLAQANNQGRLPDLKHLDISQNDIGMATRHFVRFFRELQVFPSLINFILCDCHLELQDLCCLTQARLDGKLPRIRHLDISLNRLSDHVGILSRDPITQREISWGNVVCCEKVGTVSCYDPKEILSECVDPKRKTKRKTRKKKR